VPARLDAATAHETFDLLDSPALAKCDKRDALKVCELEWPTAIADLRAVVMGDDDDVWVAHELDCLERSIWQREDCKAGIQLSLLDELEQFVVFCHFRQAHVDLWPSLVELA
jgi:hypothetical protein